MTKARQWGLAFAFISTPTFLFLFPRTISAQSTLKWEATQVYQTEGRNFITFNVKCTSTTWSTVASSDTIRRAIIMQSASSNTASICLMPGFQVTDFSTNTPCNMDTAGIELSSTTAGTSIWKDYTMFPWNCRAASNASTQTIKGYWTRDRGDFGHVGALGAQ